MKEPPGLVLSAFNVCPHSNRHHICTHTCINFCLARLFPAARNFSHTRHQAHYTDFDKRKRKFSDVKLSSLSKEKESSLDVKSSSLTKETESSIDVKSNSLTKEKR